MPPIVYPSIHPSIYLSVYLSIYLSIYLSVYLHIEMCIYIYTHIGVDIDIVITMCPVSYLTSTRKHFWRPRVAMPSRRLEHHRGHNLWPLGTAWAEHLLVQCSRVNSESDARAVWRSPVSHQESGNKLDSAMAKKEVEGFCSPWTIGLHMLRLEITHCSAQTWSA